MTKKGETKYPPDCTSIKVSHALNVMNAQTLQSLFSLMEHYHQQEK